MILQRVSPVTHSIGNCLKRVIVIVASIIFFKNPVSQQNIIGTSSCLWWMLTVFVLRCIAEKSDSCVQAQVLPWRVSSSTRK